MNISEVIISLRNETKLKAFVSITVDDNFVIKGLRIIKGNRGLFVAMPSRQSADGTFKDVVHPINRQTREAMESLIVAAYQKRVREVTQQPLGELAQV